MKSIYQIAGEMGICYTTIRTMSCRPEFSKFLHFKKQRCDVLPDKEHYFKAKVKKFQEKRRNKSVISFPMPAPPRPKRG
jgi:hypothetical protein